jgi:probable HAF family extracellular repeat protein
VKCSILLFLLATFALSGAWCGTFYTFDDLAKQSASLHARALNNAGQVTGYTYSGAVSGVFLFGPQGLSFIPGTDATGINNLGQVVGYTTGPGGWPQAFLYTPGAGEQALFPDKFTSWASSINDRGQIIGTYSIGDGSNYQTFAFIRQPDGSITTLPDGTFPQKINASGLVGGQYQVPGTFPHETHAFLYDSTSGLLDLGLTTFEVLGMNNSGQTVGRIGSPALGPSFLYQPGVGLIYFPDLFGFDANPSGINAAGQIVGWRNSDYRGFVYTPGSGVVFLDTTIPRGYDITSFIPTAINDSGQILVDERYVFTPSAAPLPDIPEPSTIGLVAVGFTALSTVGRLSLGAHRRSKLPAA